MSLQEGVVTTPLGAVLPKVMFNSPALPVCIKMPLQPLAVLLYNSVTWIFSVVCGTCNIMCVVLHDLKVLLLFGRVVSQMFLTIPFSMPTSGLAAEPVRMSIYSQRHGLGCALPLLHLLVPIRSLCELTQFSKPAKKK